MVRKKLVLSYIRDDVSRKVCFRKRKKGLINKTRELSTLCNVDSCTVIYPPNNNIPEVWPSVEMARAFLSRYLSVPKVDRANKELNPESFMRNRIKKSRDKVTRINRENKQINLNIFMYQFMYGRDPDMRDYNEMSWIINQVVTNIRSTMKKFQIQGSWYGQGPSSSIMTSMAPSPPVTLLSPPSAVIVKENMNNSMTGMLLTPTEERSIRFD